MIITAFSFMFFLTFSVFSTANPHIIADENIDVPVDSSDLSMDIDHPSVTREPHVQVFNEEMDESFDILFSLGY